jgi:colanic acid/amylovoran biosynthesis protein
MNLPKPINILIINVHSTMNAGDAALLLLNIEQLDKVFPNAHISALVNYPNEPYLKYLTNIKMIPSPFAMAKAGSEQSSWIKILKLASGCALLLIAKILPRIVLEKNNIGWFQLALLYRSADVIAAVSGAQLVSLGRYSWPLIVSSIPIIFTHYNHKPLYVMPQSIGPFRWKWERWFVRNLYSRARVMFLRDSISIKLAKDIGLPDRKIKFAFDPGFALTAASTEKALEIMSDYGYFPGQNAIGITVIAQLSKAYDQDWFANYYRSLANVLDRFIQTFDVYIYIFDQVKGPTPMEDDSIASEALLDILGKDQGRFKHINCHLTPMELKACYSLMNLFIASRFHSGIFAMSTGISTLFIGYNPKTKGFLESVSLEELMLDLNNIDENRLWDLLCHIWENRHAISEKIQKIVLDCQKDFDRVSQWITEDYFKSGKS